MNTNATHFLCIDFDCNAETMVMRKVGARLSVTPDPVKLDSATARLVDGQVHVQLDGSTHTAVLKLKDTVQKARNHLLPFTVGDYKWHVCWSERFKMPMRHREVLIIYKDNVPKTMLLFLRGHVAQIRPKKFKDRAKHYATALALSIQKAGRKKLEFHDESYFRILRQYGEVSRRAQAAAEALLSLGRQ